MGELEDGTHDSADTLDGEDDPERGRTHLPADSLATPIGRLDPLGKQLVRRSLFPRHGQPVQIGRFTVIGMIGRGGMGVVYACYDDLLARKVAVKVLDSDVSGGSASARLRLQREAQALARLSHPNVVSIHDVGALGDRVYLAMELVEGQTLGAWSRAAPRRWREVLRVVLAAGEGLAAAHEKGLVHRDIKPDNIMVGADGRVRVMDFGLARSGDEAPEPAPQAATDPLRSVDVLSSDLTRTGAVLGTPAFMAPEQFLGLVADARSDQFSLCATAWEALFGQAAFAGKSFAQLAGNVTAGRITPPPTSRGVPAWLRRVLERGLKARPDDRWPDLRALLQALRADPTRRRWIVGGTAGALSLGLAAALGLQIAERRGVAVCEGAAAVITADWDDAARQSIARAFAATGKSYATASLERTTPWLDRWADAWRAATVTACRAHTIDHTWDAALYVRASDCLGEARDNFAAVVRELRLVDGAGLALATSAAAGLASPEVCAQPEALLRRPAIDPSRFAEVQRVRARIARAASLEAAGRYKEGLAAAHEAVAAALAAGVPSTVAQAELRRGSLRERSGDYAGAEASMRRALAAAREAQAPGLALLAASELVFIVGYREARPAEGEVWAEAARTQLELWPGDHPIERADLASNLGTVRYVESDFAGAAALFAEVTALRERALGPEHPRVADSVNNLAGVRLAAGEYAESARLHTRALATYERVLGPEHPQVATCLANFALVRLDLEEYDEARRLLERSLAIREAVLGGDHPQTASTLASLAMVRQRVGALGDAARLFSRARDIYARSLGEDHPKVAECLHNLATVRRDAGAREEAAALFDRAIRLYAAATPDGGVDLANSMSELATLRRSEGAYAEALALSTRARAMIERTAGVEHPYMVAALVGVGEALEGLGRSAEAVAALEQALALAATHETRAATLADLRFTLARSLIAIDPARARALATTARDALAVGPGGEKLRAVDAWLAARADQISAQTPTIVPDP